jgi:hypothetical protein
MVEFSWMPTKQIIPGCQSNDIRNNHGESDGQSTKQRLSLIRRPQMSEAGQLSGFAIPSYMLCVSPDKSFSPVIVISTVI